MSLAVTVTIHPRAAGHHATLRLALSPAPLGRDAPCPPEPRWEPAPSQQSPDRSDATSGASLAAPQNCRQCVTAASPEDGELLAVKEHKGS